MEEPKLKCDFNVLTRPDGSVLYCEGETSVIAGIYGPVEAKVRQIQIDKACVECIYRPKTGLPGVKDRLYESLIRNICETCLGAAYYPRSAIVVNLQEMHNGGHLISCAINAACLACLLSGVEMKFMFAAVTCFLTKDEELRLQAPIAKGDVKAVFVLVFNNTHNKIVASHTKGSFTMEQYEEALSLCEIQSKHVFNFFKKSLLPVIN